MRKAMDALVELAKLDPAVIATIGGGVLAGVVPSIAGAVDLFSGDANIANSGELGVNPLLALAPAGGAIAGAGLAIPFSRDLRDYARFIDLAIKQKQGIEPTRDDKAQVLKMGRRARDSANEAMRVYEQRSAEGRPMTEREALYMAFRTSPAWRAARAAGIGALVGSASAAVPAVIAMGDAPAPQVLAQ